jgi:hypothetical protein
MCISNTGSPFCRVVYIALFDLVRFFSTGLFVGYGEGFELLAQARRPGCQWKIHMLH